ncbi:MAG: Smr/MutS family protein [Alphaproteobacteria bacterium]|nr:Smr/MutS family protein [Alphaproteobacteria bacterium]MBV9541468.1 Smr/MutS family protein [Alphaproteobacteria bacterium]MBV9904654.1 Smr/MutS family protein [Alphaproteobacteria bacterium]
MSKRKTTEEERDLFAQSFAEARPLAPLTIPTRQSGKVVKVGATGVDGNTADRMRRGVLEPDARLDLHGITESAAHNRLLVFLKNAQLRGHKLVLVVTGKGKAQAEDAPFDMELNQRSRGVLKTAVPRWLEEHDFAGLVASTRAAHKKHGGEGALYIYLRKP